MSVKSVYCVVKGVFLAFFSIREGKPAEIGGAKRSNKLCHESRLLKHREDFSGEAFRYFIAIYFGSFIMISLFVLTHGTPAVNKLHGRG